MARKFDRKRHLSVFHRNGSFELLSPLQITIGLALGDRPVPGQAFGRLGQGRVLAEKGASLIEPVGFLSIAGARHTTYTYVYLCHNSRGFSCCLTLLPIADGPVKLEVTFCVQAVITAPCGVPISVSVHSPSSITPAFNHFWMSRRIRRSATRCCTNLSIHSWDIESKNPRMSASST